MARLARVEIFRPDEIAVVHVMNRTVRRCFLLGNDPVTGKNFDHRKSWIEVQLVRLAGLFGIDLLCHAIMSNHFHLVLRSRPDVVEMWSDTEVARRWLTLCPPHPRTGRLRAKTLLGIPVEEPERPSESELNSIRLDQDKIAVIRARLSDISWWMRLLSQNIAQRANREDAEIGKFWQARYKAVRLLDETSLLACAAYVELNPIRARIAESLETSDYTSIQKRIQAQQTTKAPSRQPTCEPGIAPDLYLAPLAIDESDAQHGPCRHAEGHRCSDKGFLPMASQVYLTLLNWTASQLRNGPCDHNPEQLRPIFERLGIRATIWCELVRKFGSLFYAVAGKPHVIDSRRQRDCKRRYKATRAARELLAA